MSQSIQEVDVRRIAPPQRHPQIFATFDALKPGEAFHLVNDHDPRPLLYQFQSLRPGAFSWEYEESGPNLWRIRISKRADAPETNEPQKMPTGGCGHHHHQGHAMTPGKPVVTHFSEHLTFQPSRFTPLVLAQSDKTKVIQACFQPGQFIPVHKPDIDLTIFVLEGEGRLATGDVEQPIKPGVIAFIPAGEARGIKASTRLVILHIVTPPPTDADHVEVAKGLQKGQWK